LRRITDEWRLKLLALVLAILMLGAVAFSQSNIKTLLVNITYTNRPPNLVVVTPLDRIAISVSAPSDLPLTPASVTATADLTHIKKGAAIAVPIQVKPTDLRIAYQQPAPITLNVDDLTTVSVPVQVNTPNSAPGWLVTKAVARCPNGTDNCNVTFVGPASVAANLAAFVTVNDVIQGSSTDILNEPVQFQQNGRPLDLSKLETLPPITISPSTVNPHVEAKRGTASVQVTLWDDTPTHYPPPGYRVTGVTVSPLTVLCTGPADAIAGLTSILLPGVDLSRSTSNATFKVQIPMNTGGVTCSAAVASVTYTIAANPNTQPSPTPT
jgi:YbbR domain-containing protein